MLPISILLFIACGDGGGNGSGGGKTNGDDTVPASSKIFYLKASNTGREDAFGTSVSLSGDGDTLAVGASEEDSNATGIDGDPTNDLSADSGAVYVFERDGDVWRQQAYVKSSNSEADDNFGFSVSLSTSGNRLAVGAYREDGGSTGVDGDPTNDLSADSGAVYVFDRSGDVWRQQAYIKASNTGRDDRFGVSVSLSGDGDTLAVGANQEDSNATGINSVPDDSNFNTGAVYVFDRSGDVWRQQAFIKASNTGELDSFGFSVSLSGDGDTLAVGAPQEDSNATGIDGDQTNDLSADSGAVYVFDRSGDVWRQQAYVKSSNTGSADGFGSSVSLGADGNKLAVGTPQEDNTSNDSGAVYVFDRSGDVWRQQARINIADADGSDSFGNSVSLGANGDTLVASAHTEDGGSAGIGGDPSDNSKADSGAVYVFDRNGDAWNQRAYVKASNTGENDMFGVSVNLSADGKTLAAGAVAEGGSSTGVDGSDNDDSRKSGAVYVWSPNP